MKRQITVADYLSKALDLSDKTLRTIADEVGYAKPNILSMMRQGSAKVPIEKIPPLAKALGVDPANFTRVALREYLPNVWEVIETTLGRSVEDREMEFLRFLRDIDPEGRTVFDADFKRKVADLLRESLEPE